MRYEPFLKINCSLLQLKKKTEKYVKNMLMTKKKKERGEGQS